MGVFENLPYTNFHETNLSWALQQIKSLNERMDSFVAEVKEEIVPLVEEAIEQGLIDITYDPTTETIIMVPGDGVTSDNLARFFQIQNYKYPIADTDARNMIDLLSVYVTPQMFGAKADGITDDTAAIQSAINNAGLVIFPDGEYLISEPINIPSNTHVLGTGAAVIKIKRTDNIWRELSFSFGEYGTGSATEYNGVHDVIVEGITLDGNYNPNFTSTGHGGGNFGLSHCKNIVIRNCTFKNMVNDHYIDLAGSENILIDNCVFKDTAVLGTDSYEAINIDFSSQVGFPHFGAWDDTPCNNIKIIHCVFSGLKTHAYAIGCHYVPDNAMPHENIIISDCLIDDCSSALRFNRGSNIQFVNNRVINGDAGVNVWYDKFTIVLQRVSNVVISNNEFIDLIYGAIKAENLGGADTTYYADYLIANNVFQNINTQHDNGSPAMRLRYIDMLNIKNNIHNNCYGWAANNSYCKNVSVIGNNATGTAYTACWGFDNVSVGQVLFNQSDRVGTSPYSFGANNSSLIQQGNQNTSIAAV